MCNSECQTINRQFNANRRETKMSFKLSQWHIATIKQVLHGWVLSVRPHLQIKLLTHKVLLLLVCWCLVIKHIFVVNCRLNLENPQANHAFNLINRDQSTSIFKPEEWNEDVLVVDAWLRTKLLVAWPWFFQFLNQVMPPPLSSYIF
jgi:hypothetical protein